MPLPNLQFNVLFHTFILGFVAANWTSFVCCCGCRDVDVNFDRKIVIAAFPNRGWRISVQSMQQLDKEDIAPERMRLRTVPYQGIPFLILPHDLEFHCQYGYDKHKNKAVRCCS